MTLVRAFATALIVATGWAMWLGEPQAHKTVVSKFTYYQDVQPILEARCGRCHVEGGVASTLLTYEAAKSYPWGIQQELLSRRMPPFGADQGLAPLKGHTALSIREFDALITWAAGGTPEGAPSPRSTPRSAATWPLGEPDLIISMPAGITLPADQSSLDRDVTLTSEALAGKWIRAVDIQPGARSILRRAEVDLGQDVLAHWLPGEAPQPLEGNGAFRANAGDALTLKLHYQRAGGSPLKAEADQSRIGLYFADAKSAQAVRTQVVSDAAAPFPITQPGRLIAIRPISGPAGATVRVTLIDRAGNRTPIARMRLMPEWPRRYALQSPIALPAGGRLEVHVTPSQASLWGSLTADPVGDDATPLRIALESVR